MQGKDGWQSGLGHCGGKHRHCQETQLLELQLFVSVVLGVWLAVFWVERNWASGSGWSFTLCIFCISLISYCHFTLNQQILELHLQKTHMVADCVSLQEMTINIQLSIHPSMAVCFGKVTLVIFHSSSIICIFKRRFMDLRSNSGVSCCSLRRSNLYSMAFLDRNTADFPGFAKASQVKWQNTSVLSNSFPWTFQPTFFFSDPPVQENGPRKWIRITWIGVFT